MFEGLGDIPYFFCSLQHLSCSVCSHIKCQLSRLEFTEILARIGNREDPD